jgi:aryl-alcohol dehydrogenase-like predicted oxidoreductase
MNYVNLGRTGLKVSRLCLGTMNFGPRTPEPEAHALMDRALELGLNFFDTADIYGWKTHEGYTEQIIGRWFALGDGRREKVVLATKFQGEMGIGPNDRGASARYIRHAVEKSLMRLQTDYLDLYQMHHVNRDTPWDEVWQAFDVLIQQGKVLYAGSSNHAGWQIAQANEAAHRRHALGYVSEQCKYSLLCRHAELEILPACRAYGLGAIAWSPLESGLLGGRPEETASVMRRGREDLQKRFLDKSAQFDAWENLCRELGEKPADVALAWVLRHPAITAPIIGPRTANQMEGSLRALEIKLSAEVLQKLDVIFPPCGMPEIQGTSSSPYRLESPEAFAW